MFVGPGHGSKFRVTIGKCSLFSAKTETGKTSIGNVEELSELESLNK